MTLALPIPRTDARAIPTPAGLRLAPRGSDLFPEAPAIDRRAPVAVEARIDIAAPLAAVWRALAARPLGPGPVVAPATGGGGVRAHVTAVVPERALDWAATDRDAREMHGWRLALHGAGTRLTLARSAGGSLAAQDPRMTKEVLIHALRASAVALKAEVEAGQAARR